MPTLEPTKAISSRQNPGFQLLREITTSARARRSHQAAWIEGERLCQSFTDHCSGLAPILVASTAIGLTDVPAACRRLSREVWLLDHKLYAEITQVEAPIGWGLLIPLLGMQAPKSNGDIVVLDRLQDPGNAGSIMRSAAAAGAQAVWAVQGSVDLWSPKVLRAGMGAHFVIQIRQDLQPQEAIAACQQQDADILVTANSNGADSIFDSRLRLEGPVAWIFGQEGSGVGAEFLAAASPVSIPQADAVESLNVAAAAAVCLFESRRRKLASRR